MIAVIFEVEPHREYLQDYLQLAGQLRAELEQLDGFISVERFSSLTNEGKLLSLSFFRDEAAVAAWRNKLAHREAQAVGKGKYFARYRIRVAEVLRDYSLSDAEPG